MSRILAIDPGPVESAYVVTDPDDLRPAWFGKVNNLAVLDLLSSYDLLNRPDIAAIEQIGHYGTGMPAGRDVFDTCVWIGRYVERLDYSLKTIAALILRAKVKTHLCGTPKARDSNVRQALVDRFAPGQPNHGKGTKAEPGWFFGFHSDIWQAYALAVYVADTLGQETT